MGKADNREALWTPIFVIVLGVSLCTLVTGQASNAGMAVFVSQQGGTAAFAGVLAAGFSLSAALSRFICGPFADMRGRYATMIGGCVLMALGVAGPLVSTNEVFFTICRVVQGIGFSAASTATTAAAADVLPFARLGEGIGYYGLAQALATTIGPAGALFMLSLGNDNLFFVMMACVSLCALGLSIACRYEKHPETLPKTSAYRSRVERQQSESEASIEDAKQKSTGFSIRNIIEPGAFAGGVPIAVMNLTSAFSVFFASAYGLYLGIGNLWIYFTLAAAMMLLIRLKSSSYMDVFGSIVTITVAIVTGIIAVSLLLVAGLVGDTSAASILFYLAGVFYGIFNGLISPVNQTVAMRNSPSENWGAASGTFMLLVDIGMAAGGIGWGVVNDAWGYSASIIGVIISLVISYALAWIFYPAGEKHFKRR